MKLEGKLKEDFVPIPDYEGYYSINKNGDVRSNDRVIQCKNGQKRRVKGKGLKYNMIGNYYGVTLCKGKKTIVLVHRLLAITFIPNPENKPCVNHKDGNKLNNSLDNLEWVTYPENIIHAYRTGLMSAPSGEDHYAFGKPSFNRGNVNKKELECHICKTKFLSYVDRKYCSRKCYYKKEPHNKGIDNRTIGNCKWCGAEFRTYRKTQTFCSKSCKSLNQEELKRNS